MPEVGGVRARQEKGLAQVTAEAKIPCPLHKAKIHLISETKDLIHHDDSNGLCDVEFGPIMMSTNAAIFSELLTVKPHELLITG